MIIDCFPDRVITVNGKPFLYFGGTSYLALTINQDFQNNLITGIKNWGTAYGSSRNSNIKLAIYNQAEEKFSELINAEATSLCSSGTLAGKIVIGFLSKENSTFYHLPKTHPAILHKDSSPVFLNNTLHHNLLNNTVEHVVISADAILALEVKPTSFEFLNEISSKKKITLIVDESHSLGIIGKHLNGVFSSISNKKLYRKVMVSSLGKALGMPGGIIAADSEFIDLLKDETDFISSSSISPAYLEAFLLSQDIIKKQRKKLDENLSFIFDNLTLNSCFKFNKNYPVIYCENQKINKYLKENDIIVTNFKYPTYKTKMNRIIISSNHTKHDLNRLKQALITFN